MHSTIDCTSDLYQQLDQMFSNIDPPKNGDNVDVTYIQSGYLTVNKIKDFNTRITFANIDLSGILTEYKEIEWKGKKGVKYIFKG